MHLIEQCTHTCNMCTVCTLRTCIYSAHTKHSCLDQMPVHTHTDARALHINDWSTLENIVHIAYCDSVVNALFGHNHMQNRTIEPFKSGPNRMDNDFCIQNIAWERDLVRYGNDWTNRNTNSESMHDTWWLHQPFRSPKIKRETKKRQKQYNSNNIDRQFGRDSVAIYLSKRSIIRVLFRDAVYFYFKHSMCNWIDR